MGTTAAETFESGTWAAAVGDNHVSGFLSSW